MARRINTRSARLRKLLAANVPRGFQLFVAGSADLDKLAVFSRSLFGATALKRKTLRHCLNGGHSVIFGLRRNGDIVACCVLEMNARQKRIYLTEIGVAGEWRGKKLALWMMARAEEMGRTYGYRTLASHVAARDSAALALQRKAGLSVRQRIPEYYDDGRAGVYLRKDLIKE